MSSSKNIRLPAALLAVLLLFSLPFAILIKGTVQSSEDVHLTGVLVQVSDGQNITYVTQSVGPGLFNLTLDNRTYFLMFSRASYPELVLRYTSSGDATLDVIMLVKASFSTLYGRVIGGSGNDTVYLIRDGLVASKGQAKSGLYLIPSLQQGGYQVRVGGSNKSWDVALPYASSTKLDLNLVPAPAIIMPKGEWAQGEPVTFRISEDNVSSANAEVQILGTGNSVLKFISGQDGTVTVSLAPGNYTAVFKGASTDFTVLQSPAAPNSTGANPSAQNNTNATASQPQAPAQPPGPGEQGNSQFAMGFTSIAVLLIVIVVLAVILAVAYLFFKGAIKL